MKELKDGVELMDIKKNGLVAAGEDLWDSDRSKARWEEPVESIQGMKGFHCP